MCFTEVVLSSVVDFKTLTHGSVRSDTLEVWWDLWWQYYYRPKCFPDSDSEIKSLKIGKYLTNLRRTKQSVTAVLGHPKYITSEYYHSNTYAAPHSVIQTTQIRLHGDRSMGLYWHDV